MQLTRLKSIHARCRRKVGQALESVYFHRALIALITADAIIVLIDLGYTLLSPTCATPDDHGDHHAPEWVDILAHVSLALTCLFMVEIPVSLWAFGIQFYNPFGPVVHASFHLFDAVIIIGTFVLEIILTGREREFAGLLVILRLWRLIKLAGGIVVGMGDLEADTVRELDEVKKELKETKTALASAMERNKDLKRRLQQLDPESEPNNGD